MSKRCWLSGHCLQCQLPTPWNWQTLRSHTSHRRQDSESPLRGRCWQGEVDPTG